MEETKKGESARCPVCASRHITRAVVMRSDYRCPDCSALFNADKRIVADPRPWVDPRAQRGGEVASDMRTGEAREHTRTGATAAGSDETRIPERTEEDDPSERRARTGTERPRRSG